MRPHMRNALCIAGLVLMVMLSAAPAQQPTTQQPTTQQAAAVRIRGTIETVDGNLLTVKTRDGNQLKLALAESALIVAVVKASLAEIKEGTFLGSGAIPQADGTQKAVEVHIFPEQMRGTGEGHRPYPTVANGTMTNGTASGATVAGVDGSTITVRYQGGEKKIVVPPDTPIVRYEVGARRDLTPGAPLTVAAASKKADGTFEASRINVGRDGIVPQ